jgi:hypothetical protein
MCNCSKPVTQTECQRLAKYANDPERRFFIYHVFDDSRGLEIAWVENGKSPNNIAIERGFVDDEGIPEWYNVNEHPCLYEKKQKT